MKTNYQLLHVAFVVSATHGRLCVVGSCEPIDLSVLLSHQFRPNLFDGVFGKHFTTSNETLRCLLDRQAERDRNRSFACRPTANIRGVGANRFAQGSESSATAREVSFQVHGNHYSDSLTESNSESHIHVFSDLLCNSYL